MVDPRVLLALYTNAAWSRGILRGFMALAHEHRWLPLHYNPASDLSWLVKEWAPQAAVIGPELSRDALLELGRAALVSVTVDRSADGVASVCLDEEAIGAMALDHLLATGLRRFSTFRFDQSCFAVTRERAFTERARAAGATLAVGWGSDEAGPARQGEHPAALLAWLHELPKPCTDSWARTVARYVRVAGFRIPEDIALVGADNDTLECELIRPALSSVFIPWLEVGRSAAKLVRRALSGQSIEGERIVISPVGVVGRRSSEVLAIEDALVAKAVRWIRANAGRRMTVPSVARAVGGGRQRLERRFRRVLNRSVQEEIRRARVEAAKTLLGTTQAGLVEVAKRSGFTNAAMLSVAFQRELGMPPGTYRRRLHKELSAWEG
jgi:LacI family transcriptional regulator